MSEQPTLPFEEDLPIDPLAGDGLYMDSIEILEVQDGDS